MSKLFKYFFLFTAIVLPLTESRSEDNSEAATSTGEPLVWFQPHRDPSKKKTGASSSSDALIHLVDPDFDPNADMQGGNPDAEITPAPTQTVHPVVSATSSSSSSSSLAASSSYRSAAPRLPALDEHMLMRSSQPQLSQEQPSSTSTAASHVFHPHSLTNDPGSDHMVRSASLSSLKGDDSPMYYRAPEIVPLPRSLTRVYEDHALSDESIVDPRHKPYGRDFSKPGKSVVNPILWQWLTDTQTFWRNFNEAHRELKAAQRKFEQKEEEGNKLPIFPEKVDLSASSSSILGQWKMTPDEKVAASYQRAKARKEVAEAAYQILADEAQRRHPSLSLDDIINKLACGTLATADASILHRKESSPLTREKSAFKAFVIDPFDLKISLGSLTNRLERIERENEALIFLNRIYKQEILDRVGGWRIAAWKEWLNLNKKEGPLHAVIDSLLKKFPFKSLTRWNRDLSTNKGVVMAALHRDERGTHVWKRWLQHVQKYVTPFERNFQSSSSAMQKLDEQYRNLPKDFTPGGEPILGESVDRGNFSQKVYDGLDITDADWGDCEDADLRPSNDQNLQAQRLVRQRMYTNKKGDVVPFYPMKDNDNAGDATRDDYRKLIETIRDVRDEVNAGTGLVANSLADKWTATPKKYNPMVRSFRSFKSLEFHRTIYKDVLRQLHLKLKPVMIGCGDGLTKPHEPQPTDDPIIFPYIYDQIKDYNVLCTKMEFLLESNRNLWRQITSSQGSWTYIPSAWEFVVFTKPEKPKTDMIKFGVADPQLETFDLRKSDLTDEELLVKWPTTEGLKGIFHWCKTLDLSHNKLSNPSSAIDFTNLTTLYANDNNLGGLFFLEKSWGQLERLSVAHNRIVHFPQLTGVTTHFLQYLDISHNKLVDLTSVGKMIQLFELDVSGNPVITLTGLGELRNLQVLRAHNCELTGNWDIIMPPIPELSEFDARKNPRLVMLPYDDTQQDDDSIPQVAPDVVQANDNKFNGFYPHLARFKVGDNTELEAKKPHLVKLSDLLIGKRMLQRARDLNQ